jgi:predicted outer membrane lipoprotein
MFAIIEDNIWSPTIGDPTFMGWLTVVAYLLTAILAVISALKVDKINTHKQKYYTNQFIWWLIALILLFLGINKQLDLQSWLTVTGKNLVIKEGWYESRRIVQGIFIVTFSIFVLAFMITITWLMKNNRSNARWGLIGLSLLSSFVIIRAASFHHVDKLISFAPSGIRFNWILELGGILAIAISALQNLKIKVK